MSIAVGPIVGLGTQASALVPSKLENLQALRFFAAALVVAGHAGVEIGRLYPAFDSSLRRCGVAGVDLFFVISGFVMVYTTRRGDIAMPQFLMRRAIRIVPLYWLATLAMVTVALIAPRMVNGSDFSIFDLARSLFFVPYENAYLQEIRPVLQLGWTLNYEIFFYLLFGVTLKMGASRQTVLLGTAFVFLACAQVVTQSNNVFARFYGSPIMLEFIFGMMVGWHYIRGAQLPSAQWAMLGALAVAIFLYGAATGVGEGQERVFFWGVPATIAVAGALALERSGLLRANPLLTELGDSSYALYLSHLFVIKIAAFGLGFVGFTQFGPAILAWVALVIVAVVFGFIIYRFGEVPILRGLNYARGARTRPGEV